MQPMFPETPPPPPISLPILPDTLTSSSAQSPFFTLYNIIFIVALLCLSIKVLCMCFQNTSSPQERVKRKFMFNYGDILGQLTAAEIHDMQLTYRNTCANIKIPPIMNQNNPSLDSAGRSSSRVTNKYGDTPQTETSLSSSRKTRRSVVFEERNNAYYEPGTPTSWINSSLDSILRYSQNPPHRGEGTEEETSYLLTMTTPSN